MPEYLNTALQRTDLSDPLRELIQAWSTRDPVDAANDAETLRDVLVSRRPLAARVIEDPSTSRTLAAVLVEWLERPIAAAQADADQLKAIMTSWADEVMATFVGPIAKSIAPRPYL